MHAGEFLLSAVFFFKIHFANTLLGIKTEYQDQVQHFVGPDLVPNCLLRFSHHLWVLS